MLDRQGLENALVTLGELLSDRNERFKVVAIGGGALSLTGLIDRSTHDIDLVAVSTDDGLVTAEPLPSGLHNAIKDIADVLRLDRKWMNAGPTSLLRFGLPSGFVERCEERTYGTLTVLIASRLDQIHFKLFAAADEYHGGPQTGKHHRDLQRLGPTSEELLLAASWARTHDPSEGFLIQLRGALRPFGVEPENG